MNKYKLYYGEEFSTSKLLSEFNTNPDLYKFMRNYISDILKFKSYYYRRWTHPSEVSVEVIDYGSHTNFFYIQEVSSSGQVQN
jgi:hypothetical protein